jgi:hypothetical protein
LQVSGGETRKQWAALRLRGAVDKAMIHSSHSVTYSCLLLQKEEDEETEGL